MRPGAVWSEAIRSLLTGASRAALWAVLLGAVTLGLATADQRAVVTLANQAHTFRDSGAATWLLHGLGGIDPVRCERLVEVEGIRAAGALRPVGKAAFLTAPATDVALLDATPGLADVLGVRPSMATAGVWLSESASALLGANPGTILPTASGTVPVVGVYSYPEAAHERGPAHAVLAVNPLTGRYDQCWATVWPTSEATLALLYTAFAGDRSQPPATTQLNQRLGAAFDGHAAFASRVTGVAVFVAAAAGVLIGVASARARRLEIASALHARVPKTALAWQFLIETALWTLAVVVVALPVTWYNATLGNPDPAMPVWALGMRSVGVGVLATLSSTLVTVAATSEHRLFRYFKDRV